jgi:hypothetical protein
MTAGCNSDLYREVVIARAKRDAADIVRIGWRPQPYDLVQLRGSTEYPEAYSILECAWHKAGFPIAAIKKIARSKNEGESQCPLNREITLARFL